MRVRTNADRLVTQVLLGEVWPPLADRHPHHVGADGAPFLLPGMGGVTLGVHPGDPATGHGADHLEPGLSVRARDPEANMALQFLATVGSRARLVTGAASGARGVVIGQHAYVLCDFAEADLGRATVGDLVAVEAVGQGLALADHPEVHVKNLAPDVLAAMPGGTLADGRLEVHVTTRVPAEAIGAGSGMAVEYANTDLMGAYAGLAADLSLGLEGLRIGDIVLLEDQDHRFGRGYRPGYVTVGVISTGTCQLHGHGPGPSSILSGPAGAFAIVDDPGQNLGALVGVGAAGEAVARGA